MGEPWNDEIDLLEDDEIVDAILSAAVAGGLREWARITPRKADVRHFLDGADDASGVAAALVNSWVARHLVRVSGRSA